MIIVQFHYREGRLWAYFGLSYSQGLNARNFVRMVWLFAEIARSALHEDHTLFEITLTPSGATGGLLLEHVCLPPDKVSDLLCTRSAALCQKLTNAAQQ